VNCEVCGVELPHGAMFCGECGRAVGTRAAQVVHPDSGMPIQTSSNGSPPGTSPGSRDTVILEPLTNSYPELESDLAPLEQAGPVDAVDPVGPVDPADPDVVEQDLPPEVIEAERAESAALAVPDVATPDAAAPDAVPLEVRPEAASESAAPPAPSAPTAPRPDPFPWGDRGSDVFIDSEEIEQTLIVPRRDTGQRFVLQFSTGESVTVYGSGLLGRNPTPQPSEYFDQLVSISDPGKSVSKTHLEFGQDGGAFWVSDRFSGNGSVVREPESTPRRLVAGKRYRIVRGTRVDIGEQFFVVS
jgi:hypothetical protein